MTRRIGHHAATIVTTLALIIALAGGGRAETAFCALARKSGEVQVPGLTLVYLTPLGERAKANRWQYILVHQTEGPAGSAKNGALAQAKMPTRRGVTVWVETDGTVYWATAESAIPNHGDGANRNDNKYVDNTRTYRKVLKHNTLGVEFAGNFPDVALPPTGAQVQAWLILVRFLQERYGIPVERIYAHNWIDFKDARYCEGCALAEAARKLAYQPTKDGDCRPGKTSGLTQSDGRDTLATTTRGLRAQFHLQHGDRQ